MALTLQAQWSSNLLINYVTTEIQTLEPDLYFARLGVRRDVPMGFQVLTFPQTNQIAASSIGTITEGQDPAATVWGSTAYTAAGTQKGILVQVSDLLIRNSAIEVIESCTRQVKLALARAVDNLLQTTVNAGTGIAYASGKTARANLGSGDLIDTVLYVKQIRTLRHQNARPFLGNYFAFICEPNQSGDLMLNTSSGSWSDIGRYTSIDELREGKMDMFRGARVLESGNVQTYSSTVTVYPGLFVSEESFGLGYYQLPEPILVTTPDSNNPLNVYDSIGGKFSLGVTRFEETRLQRIESAVSS